MNVKAPLITLALVILVGFATYFFFIGPQLQEQADLSSEQQNLQQQEATLQAEISMLKDLQANQVRTRAQLNRISSFLPDGPDQPGFLASMQGVADSASVEVTDLSFGAPADVEGAEPYNGLQLSEMTVSTTVKGDYFRLIDFLRRIEFQLGRAMITQSVNLSPQSDESTGGETMSMGMESVMYFYRPEGSDNANNGIPTPEPSASPSDGATPAPGESGAPATPPTPDAGGQ
ncbi:type 4a pilus biogenesis protein PilO [Stomatohabitans albus]|uniref:type 4a pilus biogenesis protein PilO n=2 Tax=Stomatohabitans albus TaxID=3110766 RepID=UPI00300CEDE5